MPMQVEEAQREVRTVYIGGFVGQLVSGGLWLLSAALSTWASPRQGILVLVVGGMFIFPLTMLGLRLAGRQATLSKENPMGGLAMQVAFTIPLTLPVLAGATMYRLDWFYPAFMIIVGAHYLPFIFLYGMWQFGGLAAVLIGTGVAMGLLLKGSFSLGGWFTAGVLLLFAFLGRSIVLREQARRVA
jgi:uncharacterized protein DUF7010